MFNALEKLRRLRAGLPIDPTPEEIRQQPAQVTTREDMQVTTDEITDWTQLPSGWLIWFEERAAIREYEGGQAREHAEAEAFTETLIEMRRDGQY